MNIKDAFFIKDIYSVFRNNRLPVLCATESFCLIQQSIPKNSAIEFVRSVAVQLGLKEVSMAPITSATNNLEGVRKLLASCRCIATRHQVLNYFIISDHASITNNNNSPIIRSLRDALISWERNNGGDPDEDWGKMSNT